METAYQAHYHCSLVCSQPFNSIENSYIWHRHFCTTFCLLNFASKTLAQRLRAIICPMLILIACRICTTSEIGFKLTTWVKLKICICEYHASIIYLLTFTQNASASVEKTKRVQRVKSNRIVGIKTLNACKI